MYIKIFNYSIPSYGLMCTLGLLLATVYSIHALKKQKANINDFIIFECVVLLFAAIGAKVLFLITSFKEIDWHLAFSNLEYFNSLMSGGFVFYGGLIGGAIGIILSKKLCSFDIAKYINSIIPAIPLGHAFGRIGCFLAGCCYGREYNGILAYTYHNNPITPNDIPLFPIQLVEAILLFILFIALVINSKKHQEYNLFIYLVSYAVIRFFLEFYRADYIRGVFLGLSTSQWISLGIIASVIGFVIHKRIKNNQNVD